MSNIIVFLDTNEYRRCGHNFQSTPMLKIKEFTFKKTIQLLSTNVVIGEVLEHIEKEVINFSDIQKDLARNALSIRNLPEFHDMIKKFDVNEAIEKAKGAFNSFLQLTDCKILNSNGIDIDSLLADYFSKSLPFEDTIKKGSEFKDAFILYSLRKYADDNNLKVNIVTSDNGLRGAANKDERFRVFSRSEDLFSYITHINEEIPAQNAKKLENYISQPQINDTLSSEIENAICDTEIWVDNHWGDVDLVSVTINDIMLTYLDDINNGILAFHIVAAITLVIDYSYIDENNSYWDKENEQYLFMETSDIRLTKNVYLDFKVTLAATADEDGKIKQILEIKDLEIEEKQFGINIFVDENDEVQVIRSSSNDSRNEEYYFPRIYSTCPDCGFKISIENDGGNGFCVNCAHNH